MDYEVFVPTPIEIAHEKFLLAEVKPGETVFDMGCGDGAVLHHCGKEFRAKCIGIDVRPELVEVAAKNAPEGDFEFRCEDMMQSDVSDADVVHLYLTRGTMGVLSLKLEEDLPEGARIVTHCFDLPGWTAEKQVQVLGQQGEFHDLYLYRQVRKKED